MVIILVNHQLDLSTPSKQMLFSLSSCNRLNFSPNVATRTRFLSRIIRKRIDSRVSCSVLSTTDEPTMKRFVFDKISTEEMKSICTRPRQDFPAIMRTVGPILEDVRRSGDQSVTTYTKKFDSVLLDWVCKPIEEIETPQLEAEVQESFKVAYNNIKKFHEAQKIEKLEVETMPGVVCQRISRPIESVGLYVPGGTAVLPSSALMLTVPAKIAGCKTIVLSTPPTPNGRIAPEVLFCAKLAGATHILKAGGAQAIGAMAWGTDTCPQVDKLFGPGNQYVTAAKMYLQNSEAMISIDMPAGPSEVLVIADSGANATHVAVDLLSQAEHGPDSQAVLVVLDSVDIEAIAKAIEEQLLTLPRATLARKSLVNSKIIVVKNRNEAVEFSNSYAPEHLIINTEDAESYVDNISNAGSVFLGRYTPESVGDYASGMILNFCSPIDVDDMLCLLGTNHVLPTYGYARMYSGVSLDSFLKKITVQKLTKSGLQLLGPHVARMAEVETLEAHKRAVILRLQKGC